MRSRLTDIPVVIVYETDAAVLVRIDEEGEKVWLPKRAIEISRDDPNEGVAMITLDERLAQEKGLI